ncbi:MAG: Hsp70 family protein [Bryobacteraceae bacterium]|jgi:molecular chaperone DnaK (HSP70)
MTSPKKPCPDCSYEVVEDDLYCASCGRRLFEFRVEPTRLNYYVDPDCPGAMRRQLRVSDGGWGHPVLECDGLPEWLRFDPDALTLTVDADQLPWYDMVSESITIRARGTDVERDIEISVAPLPVPEVQPLTLARGYTSGTPARLELSISYPATVENLTFRPRYLELDTPLPIELPAGKHTIPLTARIPAGQEGIVRSIGYSMTLGGLTNTLTGNIELILQDPPSLSIVEIDEGYAPPVLNEAEGEFVLTCWNRGRGANLLVEELVLSPRPGTAAPAIGFSREPARASIEKGQSVQFVFQARPTGQVAPGRYAFEVIVRSNDPSAENNRKPLAVRVTDEEFLQCVAIDYGTIDSTIAVFDNSTGGPINLLLERRRDKDPKIYSNVFFSNYLPGETPPFEWDIGGRAAALGPSGQLVTAVKVRVGSGQKEHVEFSAKGIFCEVEPEQVVTMALRSLLVRAKHALKQKPSQFAMCVPTRFTLRRKEILREALQEAARQLAMEISVRLVDESLAAGVFSILAGTAGGAKAEFTMMVVDFGGGTTDITVFRVKRDPATKALLSAEIIGAWGDPDLGGEVITQELAAALLAEFSGKPDASPTGIRRMTVEAERLKVAVSELEEALRQAGASQVSAVIEKLGPRASERIGYVCLLKGTVTPEELRESVQEYLSSGVLSVRSQSFGSGTAVVKFPGEKVIKAYETRLEKLKAGLLTLLQRIGLSKVDQVLLAGQSSKFPTVWDYLKDFGEEISFITNEKGEILLKECVSQGALMLVGEGIKVDGEDRLWTRLGYVTGARFHELIGWGTQYPVTAPEIELNRHQVSQGWLQVEILENMNLVGVGPLARFGRFKIQVGDAAGPFYFKLHLDEKAAPHGFCRLVNESPENEMEFIPQPAF